MIAVVLDENFRRAQRDKLGDNRATLEDLRTAIGVALAHDKLVKALACVGVYRSAVRDSCFIEDTFKAVEQGDLKRSLRLARHYRAATSLHGTWARALHLYLAWEAAEAGDVASAVGAAGAAEDLPEGQSRHLCRALLARTARALAAMPTADRRSALDWLRVIAPGEDDPQALLDTYDIAKPLASEEMENALEGLRMVEKRMDQMAASMAAEWDAEKRAQLAYNVFDAEAAAFEVSELAQILTRMAAEETGQERIDKLLLPVLSNPYPEYRDLALLAMSATILGVPDRFFVRAQLQRIFKTTLNSEGVTFTYDLPCVLLMEAGSRGMPAVELSDYFARAYDLEDVWGTKLRARSARAAALFRQGRADEAASELVCAAQFTDGFSGFMAVHLLSLLNRRAEFGWPEDDLPARLEQVRLRAETVSDWEFRDRRRRLVETYASWVSLQPGELGLEPVRAEVSRINDPDVRTAYYDFVSARWAHPAAHPKWEELKSLVPLALGHGTTLDAVLGRLFGLRVRQLTDEDLAEAVRICAVHLTTSRPWELGL
jgi:hypothetical protein